MDEQLAKLLKTDTTPCQFVTICNHSGPGCTSETSWCPDHKKRTNLCPQMIKSGFPESHSKCNIPTIRAIVPPELDCRKSGICIHALIPEIKPLIAIFYEDSEIGVTPRANADDLHNIKEMIQAHLQKHKEKPLDQAA